MAIVAAVASALDAAHAAGLVHRDVKPANMLVDLRPGRPDHIYLSDFGLAKNAAALSSLTGTDHFLGTLDYCAPEQIQGKAVDGRADQYALACSAFTALAGEPPFARDGIGAVVHAQIADPPPRCPGACPGCPPRSTASWRGPWPRRRATATAAAVSSPRRWPRRSGSPPPAAAAAAPPGTARPS